ATMVITTLLAYVVARHVRGWRRSLIGPVTAFFLLVDVSFFGANIIKVEDGGWFPLLVGICVYTLMVTWKRGGKIPADRLQADCLPLEQFVGSIKPDFPIRVPGTAIFLARDPNGTPPSLLHNLKHNKVLHSKVVILTLVTEEVPMVPATETIEIQPLGKEFYRVLAHHGFMQTPEVPEVLGLMRGKGLDLN